jgi:hypothetical protein
MEYQKKFTQGQKFTTKARNFSEYLSAAEEASKNKTIAVTANKNANGFDRNPKNIIMEGKFKTIGGVKVEVDDDGKVQFILPKGMGKEELAEYKKENKEKIEEFTGKPIKSGKAVEKNELDEKAKDKAKSDSKK